MASHKPKEKAPAMRKRLGQERDERPAGSPVILTVSSICTSSEPVDPRASIVYTPTSNADLKSET
jgi:hypothetical protein